MTALLIQNNAVIDYETEQKVNHWLMSPHHTTVSNSGILTLTPCAPLGAHQQNPHETSWGLLFRKNKLSPYSTLLRTSFRFA
jgi:hypothetical protein